MHNKEHVAISSNLIIIVSFYRKKAVLPKRDYARFDGIIHSETKAIIPVSIGYTNIGKITVLAKGPIDLIIWLSSYLSVGLLKGIFYFT